MSAISRVEHVSRGKLKRVISLFFVGIRRKIRNFVRARNEMREI